MRLLLTGGCNRGAVRWEVLEPLVLVSGWNRLRVWKPEDDHRPTCRSDRNARVSRGGGLRSHSSK